MNHRADQRLLDPKPACDWHRVSVASHYTSVDHWIYGNYFYIHFSKKKGDVRKRKTSIIY